MKQVVLNIKDSKLPFFMELIKNFEFIQVESFEGDSKKEVIENLKNGFSEMELIKKGKVNTTTLKSSLDEL